MTVSVIIPTLNEAACIQETVRSLRRQHADEIIIVDGGSTDGTQELGRNVDAVLFSAPGRAVQMHAGALKASSEYILFLHADCTLAEGALAAMERSLRQPRVIAGCLSMTVQHPGWLYRAIDWCASARVKLTGLVYGDQGLFMRRADYLRLGGFPPLRFMEDVFFSHTLRRYGRIVVLPQKIFVSPRRWQKSGIICQTLRNWMLTALAAGGVHPNRLAKYYPRVR